MLNSREAALLCAAAAGEKKAFDIQILDLRGLTYITDYFVICSGGNIIQVAAIADSISHALAQQGMRPFHVEGGTEATWLLMDCGDVVVHVFEQSTRIYYSLEKLWGDAPRIAVSSASAVLSGASS